MILRAIVPTHSSIACRRIGDAIAQYAPVQVVARPYSLSATRSRMENDHDGDIVILLVNSFVNRYSELARQLLDRGQRYAVVQIALRTTPTPNANDPKWRTLWDNATCVWSYYNLNQWIRDEGGTHTIKNFYHAPLGVDGSVFRKTNYGDRSFTMCTSGRKRVQEGVRECDLATHNLNGQIFHLGPTMGGMISPTQYAADITDEQLADRYNDCQFVSGLRRHEGFELPAAEGLLCGARPILYDQPHYRDWYGPWAEFIPESEDRIQRAADIEAILRRGASPLTDDELTAAAARFNWDTIASGFWKRILETYD